jgi:putative SOS response-associated peptidase YedK
MCGRFSLFSSPLEMMKRFKAKAPKTAYRGRYNIAPGQMTLVLPMEQNQKREFEMQKWGFIPHWNKNLKPKGMINARGESILAKPYFREAARKKRCLVPADGFYEWERTNGKKIPFRVAAADDQPFAMAGLCDEWVDPVTGEVLKTFSIVTTVANTAMKKIHDRMPVILEREDEGKWIDEKTTPEEIQRLCRPLPANKIKAYQITDLVNNPRNDTPEIIKPIEH